MELPSLIRSHEIRNENIFDSDLESYQTFCILLLPWTVPQVFQTLPLHFIRANFVAPIYLPNTCRANRRACTPLVSFTCWCCFPTSTPTLSMHSFFPLGTDRHPYTHGSTARSRITFVHLCTMYLPRRARSRSYNHPQSRSRSAQADSDHWRTHVPCSVKTAHTDRLPLLAQAGLVTSPSGSTTLHRPAPSTGAVTVGHPCSAQADSDPKRRPSHAPRGADNGCSRC